MNSVAVNEVTRRSAQSLAARPRRQSGECRGSEAGIPLHVSVGQAQRATAPWPASSAQ